MSLCVEGVSYFVQAERGQDSADSLLCLLSDVSVTIPAGSVTAIMGPSGSGKTSLMELLTNRKKGGFLVGRIILDGVPSSVELARSIAYVPSTDVHIGEFTVMESLYYSAQLRMGGYISGEACRKRCLKVAEEVGLETSMDTVIGTALNKGISGGQMRRLTIATELLALPRALCLDEPTTGLDSAVSFQLALCLSNLAVRNARTVICTVHQPSQDMLSVWQNLILLSKGSLVYSGPISELASYVTRAGYSMSESRSATEYVLKLLGEESSAADFARHWKTSTEGANPALNMVSGVVDPLSIPADETSLVRQSTGFLEQVKILISRHSLYFCKSIHGLFSIALRSVLSALVYGMAYYKNDSDWQEQGYIVLVAPLEISAYTYNLLSLSYSLVIFFILISALSIPAYSFLRQYYDQEKDNKLYHPAARFLSLTLIDVSANIVGTLVFVLIVQKMIGLTRELLAFYSTCVLLSVCGYAAAMVSSLLMPDAMSALVFFGGVSAFQMCFAGFVVVYRDMQSYLQWCIDIAFSRYSTGSIMNVFFKDRFEVGNLVLDYYGYDLDYFRETNTILILLAFFISFEFIVFMLMWPRSSEIKKCASLTDVTSNDSKLGDGHDVEDDDSAVVEDGDEERSAHIRLSHMSPMHKRASEGDLAPSLRKRMSATGSVGSGKASLLSLASKASRYVASLSVPINAVYDDETGMREGRLFGTNNRNTYTEQLEAFRPRTVIPEEERCTVSFEEISYRIQRNVLSRVFSRSEGRGSTVHLLKGISATARSGEICAIMGPSGCGKTTLLNVLAGKATLGYPGGKIFVNELEIPSLRFVRQARNGQNQFAYVMQDDALNPMLTVKETLVFASMLRLRTTNENMVEGYVSSTMYTLGLESVQNVYINTEQNRVLSKGQLRRLTIGIDIVNAPPIIFLDEPTSGLDSYLAETIIDSLVSLSQAGHTVVCTVHQPSSSIFTKFNGLILLAQGELVYHGPASRCISHFTASGFDNRSFENPAEFAIDMCKKHKLYINDSSNVSIGSNKDYALKQIHKAVETVKWDKDLSLYARVKDPFAIMITLIRRDLLSHYRRKFFWMSAIIRTSIVGVFMGAVFWDMPNSFVLMRLGLFLVTFIYTSGMLIEALPVLHEEKRLFYREREAGAVTTFTHWVVLSAPITILFMSTQLFFVLPLYIMSGLNPGFENFIKFFVTVAIINAANMCYIQLATFLTPNPVVSVILFPGIGVSLQALFCGYAVLISTFQEWISWIPNLNVLLWGFNALVENEFRNNEDALSPLMSYSMFGEIFGYTATYAYSLFYIIIIGAVVKVLTLLCMIFLNHDKM